MPQTEQAIQIYTAILNQSGTNAPVATVLHNTLGFNGETIVWTRLSTGKYLGTLTGKFPENKTIVIEGTRFTTKHIAVGVHVPPNSIFVDQTALNTSETYEDGVYNLAIEIRVYQ